MKKICFVTTISMTLKAFVLDTAKYLHEKGGYEITFICDIDKDFSSVLPSYINYIPVSMKRGMSISGFKSILELLSIFKREKFDIVQYSTPNASCYASIAAKIANIPVRLYCQWGIAYVGFYGIKRRLFKAIEKMVCKISTWIEPDSFGNLNYCRSEGLYTETKSSVVWNGSAAGVNLEKFDFFQKNNWNIEKRKKHNISIDTFVFGFVGRIDKDKGFNELNSAFKRFENENVKLLIIGPEDKVHTVDKELYNWSKNSEKVVYTGMVSDVEKYFAAMDCFILPSYREGFGNVVIEAEAMGVPVIVTDIPGPTDAIKNGDTGILVTKYKIDELHGAMKMIMSNKELKNRLGENAKDFVRQKFDKKKLLEYILQDRNRLLRLSDKKIY